MAVREFTDSKGMEWRVWDVTPEHMHPVTRGEDYMANFQDGWLAFESDSEKRRLEAPYPARWIEMDLPSLEGLCARATPVVRRFDTGNQRAIRASETEVKAMESSHAQLTFRSPAGREWTVRVHECLDHAGRQRTVLRFTAGDIVVELPQWPANWQSATMQEFAVMLLDADPPRRRDAGQGPQRRHDDRSLHGDADHGGVSRAPR